MTSERPHERSPWRIAYEQLAALMLARGGASESVSLKINAKGDVQPEVVAVRQDGESLLEAYGRASRVLRVAKADFAASESLLPAEGLTAAETPFDDV